MQFRSMLSAALLLPALYFSAPAAAQPSAGLPPLQEARQARNTLFSLPESDSNFIFRIDLPGSNFLIARFNRLSYWQDGRLEEYVGLARDACRQLRDSFSSSTSARRIAIHVPPANAPLIAAVQEWGKDERVVLLRGGMAQPLRLSVDTITVLKTLDQQPAPGESQPQIQYTFLLKDLSEIEGIAADAALLARIGSRLDSLVGARRSAWKRPDAERHSLHAVLDANTMRLQAKQRNLLWQRLQVNGHFGVSLIASTIAPSIWLGATYATKAAGLSPFVGLTFNGLLFYRVDGETLRSRSSSYLNFEFGTSLGSVGLYRTAVGFGHQVASSDPGPYDAKLHLYFSYSISKAVTLMPEVYSRWSDRNKENEGPNFWGLTVLVRGF